MGLLGLLFWPERGLVWRWQQARRLTGRVLSEDALKHIHKYEMNGRHPTVESTAGMLHISLDETAALLAEMQHNNLLQITQGVIHLTPQGRESALHIIRAHRLWESHLAHETGFTEAEWHGQADQREHLLTAEELDSLAARLGHPTHDPHGDPIPTASGDFTPHGGQPLTTLPIDTPATIVHLEDEPELVYAQLVAEDLHPGMPVRVVESTPARVRFWANGDEHRLAPILAANISVRPLPAVEEETDTDCERLTCLEPGETAVIVGLSPACRGAERRRFMDLGILRDTPITAELRSPGGDPTAYRIRDAVIALRREQANLIKVRRKKDEGRN